MPCGSVAARLQSCQVIACAKDFSTHRSALRTSSPAFQPRLLQSTISKEDLERVAGIEPAYSAWKAAALPLCYTRLVYLLNIRLAECWGPPTEHPRKEGTGRCPCRLSTACETASGQSHHGRTIIRRGCRPSGSVGIRSAQQIWWRGLDSNQRRHSQRIYSPPPLATRAPLQSLAPRRTAKTAPRSDAEQDGLMGIH